MNRPAGAEAHRGGSSAASGGDWAAAMRAGDFERAWAITDRDLAALCRSGFGKHSGPRHLQRIWRGEELRGRRILVRCYHGLGDTIQFARFLRPLRERAREVMVWCQPELLALIQRMAGVDRAIPLHDGTPDADFDVDIEIMEIPHAIRAGRDLVELRGPYLTLPPGNFQGILPKHESVSVGLVWEVGNWDKRRSIPARLLRRLDGEDVRLFSLQRGAASAAAAEIGAEDISTPDIVALGRRIRQMDLVVCVDTMVAHLAGALGCEAWIMLHADCDWRWPTAGSRSSWYPTIRLFHQRISGDWTGVIEEARSALMERMVGNRDRSDRLWYEPVMSAAEPVKATKGCAAQTARVAGEAEKGLPVGGDGGSPV